MSLSLKSKINKRKKLFRIKCELQNWKQQPKTVRKNRWGGKK